jgi:hypothetical protein
MVVGGASRDNERFLASALCVALVCESAREGRAGGSAIGLFTLEAGIELGDPGDAGDAKKAVRWFGAGDIGIESVDEVFDARDEKTCDVASPSSSEVDGEDEA